MQRVLPPPEPELPVFDVSEDEVERWAAAAAARPFDISQGPLLRAALLRLGPEDHALVVAMHHIASDGLSMEVFLREMAALYGAYAAGRPSPLPEPAVQYGDYALWERGWLAGAALEERLGQARERLAGAPTFLELPTDRPRPAALSSRGGREALALPVEVEELARREGVTPFVILLSGLAALLARYTGREDLLIGSPVANRGRMETEGLIGCFINTLVLRADLGGDPGFRGLLARTRKETLAAFAHQEVPFEALVEALVTDRSRARTPLVQVVLVLQPTLPAPSLPGLEARRLDFHNGTSKFELTVQLAREAEGFAGSIEYSADLFEASTVRRLADHLANLLAGAVAEPGRRLSELPLLGVSEMEQVLVGLNPPAADWPEGGLLHEMVLAQVERTPDAVALVHGTERWTYRRLAERSERLASRLRVEPETPVGVFLRRTLELPAALLAVLRAGGAYVPLDPNYPRERAGGDPGGFGGSGGDHRRSAGGSARWCAVGDRGGRGPKGHKGLRSSAQQRGGLAYVIYTSGSTGRPKGVAIEHRSATALMCWSREVFSDAELAGVLGSTSITFDMSVFELFAPLCWGGTVILAENALELPRLAAKDEVTLVDTVPSAMAELVRQGAVPASVKTVNLGGEPLRGALARRVHETGTVGRLLNLYGPSEDTTFSSIAEVGAEGEPTIGVLLKGGYGYVLDAWGQPLPAGVPGELFLGGVGLSRGYLNRPDLTAERYVPDPFSGEPGGRLYRTSDLVRWLPSGELEYLGRLDFQVKIRGFRVELEEIEATLAAHPAVRACVVVAREAGAAGAEARDLRLVAYVVSHSEDFPGEFREHLKARLPEYMVPTAWVRMDALPLTPNGKVDRKALPAPDAGTESHWIAPRTPVEKLIAGIWSEVLDVERVGAEDDFFALGGHSLLAARAASRVGAAVGIELPLSLLFEASTPAALAAEIAARQGTAAGRSRRGPTRPRARRVCRSPSPRNGCGSWTVSRPAARFTTCRRPRGSPGLSTWPSSPPPWGRSCAAIRRCGRSSPSWTAGRRSGSRPGRPSPCRWWTCRSCRKSRARRWRSGCSREEARTPFDLGAGRLARALLLRLGGEEHVLALTFHHIAADGWSVDILLREAPALYEALAAGRPSPLAELPLQYADFAVWQRRWLQGETLRAETAWWREQLAGAPAVLELPLDRPRPAAQSFRGARERMEIAAGVGRDLQRLAQSQGATSFMALLAGFAALLGRLSGQEDVVVGSPVAGRTRGETEGLIGFFVNTLALRVGLSGDPSFETLLGRVRERALSALAHQDLPFEKLVEELSPERSLAHSPIFQAMLAVQTASQEASLPGLRLRRLDVDPGISKFDLSLDLAQEVEGGFSGWLEYDCDLFEAATAQRLAGQLVRILEAVAGRPELRLSELPLLSPAERQALLADWSRTPGEYRTAGTVLDLFAEQARKTPDRPAVVSPRESLTFRELEERSRRLARRLQGDGWRSREPLAGLLADAGPGLAAGLLGIFQSGAALVPLSPSQPDERIALIAADCGLEFLVTERRYLERARRLASCEVVCVDEIDESDESDAPPALLGEVLPESLAYVIYTSGSTGLPKGVGVSHANLMPMLDWGRRQFGLDETRRVLQSLSYAFDFGLWEILTTLVSGGAFFVPGPEEAGDAEAYGRRVKEWGIDTLHTTPSFFQAMAQSVSSGSLDGLRTLHLGGEALSRGQVERFAAAVGGECRLYNGYGPTETTVNSLIFEIGRRGALRGGERVPVGRPSAYNTAYVLDRWGEPAPLGVAGELWVGGAGVARGYLGRPELTAEKFVPDPFGGVAGARVYRTGDLVRWLASGDVEFLGRIDHQVKVRGFRIELGEVESALRRHPGVREAVVAARPDRAGNLALVGYVLGEVPAEELRTFLRERLPEAMVPAAFVTLDSLPLTSSGKVDRKALPAPSWGLPRGGRRTGSPHAGGRGAGGDLVGGPGDRAGGGGDELLRAGRALAARGPAGVAGAPGLRRGAAPAAPVRDPHRGGAGRRDRGPAYGATGRPGSRRWRAAPRKASVRSPSPRNGSGSWTGSSPAARLQHAGRPAARGAARRRRPGRCAGGDRPPPRVAAHHLLQPDGRPAQGSRPRAARPAAGGPLGAAGGAARARGGAAAGEEARPAVRSGRGRRCCALLLRLAPRSTSCS